MAGASEAMGAGRDEGVSSARTTLEVGACEAMERMRLLQTGYHWSPD
jgi:hypothetical protein